MIDRYSRSPMKDIWTKDAQFEAWFDVELAVCEYYAKIGKIPQADFKRIKTRAKLDVDRIEEIEAVVRHDVIAFTTQLAEVIGPSSRFVHLGLTSSDVVDTALALRIKHSAEIIEEDLVKVHKALKKLATKHAFTIMMGRTHGMHAEPTTFGLKVLIWHEEFGRHLDRFRAAVKRVCVGAVSGAVGTMAHTGPKLEAFVCKKLGLGVAPVSTQIIQRDRHAEFMDVLALIACTIEKIATEIRHLQRPEIRELEEPFGKGQKGSSAMPHKRNPVVAEQMTGLARIVRSNSLAAMENVTLWSERDISHSSVERVIVPDSCMLVDYLLGKLLWQVEGMTVNTKNMEANIWKTRGLVFSQKVLLELVEGGLSREDAYASVQAAAMRSWHDGDEFIDELMKEDAVTKNYTRNDILAMINPQSYLIYTADLFKRCGITVKAPAKKRGRKKAK
jgi:adenylosuccinate lyase